MVFAYLGPDTVLPLTSVFAAVFGIVLMFGRQSWRIAMLAVHGVFRLFGRERSASVPPGVRADVAHLRARRRAAAQRHEAGAPVQRDDT